MTIAAGFHCWDGIVLCADTQENVAEYLKRDQCKIEIRPEESISKLSNAPRAIFAGAGYGDFIDYLVDKLWRAMASGGENADEMINKAEEELLRIYTQLTPIYPSGMPDAELLVAVWAKQYELDLIKINGPIIKREIVYDDIGYGRILTAYIASRLIRLKSTLEDAVPVAIYLIDEARQHVRECGGDINVVTLSREGEVKRYSQSTVEIKTKQFREADYIARHVVDLALTVPEDDRFKLLLEDYLSRMRRTKSDSKE